MEQIGAHYITYERATNEIATKKYYFIRSFDTVIAPINAEK